MAITNEFIDEVLQAIGFLGEVRAKKMFGGCAFYLEEKIIALGDDDVLWWKFNAETEQQFKDAGSEQASYPTKDGQRMTMGYYSSPVGLDASPDEIRPWADLAIGAAARAAAKKKPKKQK